MAALAWFHCVAIALTTAVATYHVLNMHGKRAGGDAFEGFALTW